MVERSQWICRARGCNAGICHDIMDMEGLQRPTDGFLWWLELDNVLEERIQAHREAR
jgi:hypothetical protein